MGSHTSCTGTQTQALPRHRRSRTNGRAVQTTTWEEIEASWSAQVSSLVQHRVQGLSDEAVGQVSQMYEQKLSDMMDDNCKLMEIIAQLKEKAQVIVA